MRDIVTELREQGPTESEVERARAYAAGARAIAFENTGAVARYAAQQTIVYRDDVDPDRTIELIDAVSTADVTDVARRIADELSSRGRRAAHGGGAGGGIRRRGHFGGGAPRSVRDGHSFLDGSRGRARSAARTRRSACSTGAGSDAADAASDPRGRGAFGGTAARVALAALAAAAIGATVVVVSSGGPGSANEPQASAAGPTVDRDRHHRHKHRPPSRPMVHMRAALDDVLRPPARRPALRSTT